MELIINKTQYEKIINEDLGVSRPAIAFANLMYEKLTPKVIDFAKEKKSKVENIIIGVKDISKIWRNDPEDFLDLPITEIRIELGLTYINKTKDKSFATGGGAYGFDASDESVSYLIRPDKSVPKYLRNELDDSIISKFEIDIFITKNFENTQLDELLFDLRDTILHETNHMLEHYYRLVSGAKEMNPALAYSGTKNYFIPKSVWEVWNDFLFMVYYSEPQEIRAMTQEMYSFRIRKPIEDLKNHKYYIWADKMEKFNADEIFQKLLDSIEEVIPNRMAQILGSLSTRFFKDYYKLSKESGNEPLRILKKETSVQNLMKKMQFRINNAGKQLKRNFVRLYSIES